MGVRFWIISWITLMSTCSATPLPIIGHTVFCCKAETLHLVHPCGIHIVYPGTRNSVCIRPRCRFISPCRCGNLHDRCCITKDAYGIRRISFGFIFIKAKSHILTYFSYQYSAIHIRVFFLIEYHYLRVDLPIVIHPGRSCSGPMLFLIIEIHGLLQLVPFNLYLLNVACYISILITCIEIK